MFFWFFPYIKMYWLVENIIFYSTTNSIWCGKLYLGTFIDKNIYIIKVQCDCIQIQNVF